MTFRDAITGFIAKWCLWNECRNSVLITCQYPDLVVLLIGWSNFFSQSDVSYPDLGNERWPVWNFCPHFPDVFLQGNQSWPREMLADFSGCYMKGWKWLHECIFNSFYYLPRHCSHFFSAGYTFPYKKKPLMWSPVNMANGTFWNPKQWNLL